ncbi:uncharacterized protein PG998_008307 [Apiospora kogelbergensis]|uniref:uncharacterized protein n=1 Tax=Apiospora kogelbergensis TaxID=1337665 RepID=UPI0031306224
MTESVSGSSLLQARGDTHSTSHEHSHHHHIRSHHKRLHQHQQSHQHLEKKEAHPADDSSVVHIVQTVDVVQIIDGSGATISLSTVAPPPPPTKSAPPNVLQALPDHKVAVAATTDDAAADSLHTPIPTTPTPSPELDISASLSMSPSFPTVESYAKISSTPLPSGSSSGAFPSFPVSYFFNVVADTINLSQWHRHFETDSGSKSHHVYPSQLVWYCFIQRFVYDDSSIFRLCNSFDCLINRCVGIIVAITVAIAIAISIAISRAFDTNQQR